MQAKYLARWAQPFLGLGDIVVSIPVGDVADLSAGDRFRLSIPDLSRDPLAGATDHPGEIQIWARDKASGDDVAMLLPEASTALATRMGGLKIQREYPPETAFTPCALPRSPLVLVHRDDFKDPCAR